MLGLKNLRCSQPPAVGAVGGEMRVTGPPCEGVSRRVVR